MGIQNLLVFLKPHAVKRNIKDFAGKTVGVDAMCWMHKGAFACSQELVEGIDTDRFIHFFLRMCELLRCSEVKPLIVFDGARLPAKAKEEAKRAETRAKARAEALDMIERKKRGEHIDERQLSSKCEQAIKVTPEMINRLMNALREFSIHFLVAPYEADAQLAFMCRRGWVQAVISEDGDLLAYGCPNTLFKMDRYGDAQNIQLPCLQTDREYDLSEAFADAEENKDPDALPELKTGRGKKKGKAIGKEKEGKDENIGNGAELPNEIGFDVPQWTPEKFTQLCVLLGTDYKEHDVHIKGLAAKRGSQILSKFGSAEKMFAWMRQQARWKDHFPCDYEEYIERYRNVLAVFLHHIVHDPQRGQCSISLAFPKANRDMPGVDLESLVGAVAPFQEAKLKFAGELDPRTGNERPLVPLTPAERATLDRMIAQKREDQRRFQFDRSLKEDAERKAAERAAAAAAAAAAAVAASTAEPAVLATPSAPPVASAAPHAPGQPAGGDLAQPEQRPQQQESQPVDVEDDEEPPPSPRLKLLQGDIDAILSLRKFVTPPKQTGDDSTDALSESKQRVNPFARKRPVSMSATDQLKRRRMELSRDTGDLGDSGRFREATVKAPERRPLGGYGALDSANRVLYQRGRLDVLEHDHPPEHQDRGNILAYFSHRKGGSCQTKKPSTPTPIAQKEITLASWTARPWEAAEVSESTEMPKLLKKDGFSARRDAMVRRSMELRT